MRCTAKSVVVPLENFRGKTALSIKTSQICTGKTALSKQLEYSFHLGQKDMMCYEAPSEEERNGIADGKLTKPMAVARWLVKYSGAGASSGKYRSDIPKPTRKPCVSRSCHIEVLKEASVNPAATMSTPEMVIVRGANKRKILRRPRSRVEGVVGAQFPCSIREMTGFTRMPPAQVSP